MEGMTKEQLARIDMLYRKQEKEIQQLREQLAKAREGLKRIQAMAVRPACMCGRHTGTAAIKSAAQQTLKEIGE